MKKFIDKKMEILISIILIIITFIVKEENIEYKLKSILLLNIMIFYFSVKLKNSGRNIMIFYFVCCNFLFNVGIVYINLIKKNYLIESMFFTNNIYFSLEVSEFIYDILYLNSLGILIAILLIMFNLKKVKLNSKNISLKKENVAIKKLLFYLIIILSVYVISTNFNYLKFIMKIGYAKSYTLPKIKNIIYYINTIFSFILFIYLSLNPRNNKKFKILIFLIIINQFIISLRGSRGQFLLFIIFIFWYLETRKIFKIKMKYLVVCFILITLYSEIMVQLRSSYGTRKIKKDFEISQITELPIGFLESQVGTVGMVGYLKTFPEIIEGDNNGKMILSSFYNLYDSFFRKEILKKKGEYNYEKGSKANSFSRISYIVSYKHVKKGGGLGGNYIAEMYEIGKEYGVFFLSMIFIYIIYFLEKLYKKNKSVYINIFILMIFREIFYAPRSHYFNINFRTYFYICFLYFIMKEIFSRLKKNNNTEEGDI